MIRLNNDWDLFLESESKKAYHQKLNDFLTAEYANKNIYPPKTDLFNALKYTSKKDIKAVILGQDPYINKGEAHGLAFSVMPESKIPPSLKNIFKELENDIGCYVPNNGYLMKWAKQGVLLLNSVLTVKEGTSRSHAKMGWEFFTENIIKEINKNDTPIAFLLWGNDAQKKKNLLTNSTHLLLTAAHPSPLAGGKFFGCKHFSKTNAFLRSNGLCEIDWQIEDIPD